MVLKEKIRITKTTDILLWVVLAFAVVAGVTLRFKGYMEDSFWFDEVATFELALYPIKNLFSGIITRDSQPPLFLLLSKMWFTVTGVEDSYARMFTVLTGCLSIGAIFYLALTYAGKKTAILASLITSFHHFAIVHSQEFRSYVLLFTLSSLSLAFCSPWFLGKKARSINFYFLLITNVLLVYTHYYALILIFFENVIFLILRNYKDTHGNTGKWWTAQALVFALFAFWMPGLCYHAFHLSQGHLKNNINFTEIAYYFSPFTGSHRYADPRSFVSLIPLLCVSLYAFTVPGISYVRLLFLKIIKFPKSFKIDPEGIIVCIKIGIIFVLSNAILFLSYIAFPGEIPGTFKWSTQLIEGLEFNSLIFLFIFIGVLVSFIPEADIEKSSPDNKIVTKHVFGLLPLGVLAVVFIASIVFRENYQAKNMFIILPSFICAISFYVSGVKNDILYFLIVAVVFIGLITQVKYTHKVYERWGYNAVSEEVKEKSAKYGKNIPVLTVSHEATLCLNHYLKNNAVFDCRKEDCAEIINKNDLIFWVWHGFVLPSEKGHEEELKKQLKSNPALFSIVSHGLNAVLLNYKKGK